MERDCQDCTSLSLCDAKILATNMGAHLTIDLQNMILHLKSLCYPINDDDMAPPLYNDNNACIKWCHNSTMKGNGHIEHREKLHHQPHQQKCNPSDIFTKEMCDGANFQLHNTSMSQGADFLKGIYNSLHLLSTPHCRHVAKTTNWYGASLGGTKTCEM